MPSFKENQRRPGFYMQGNMRPNRGRGPNRRPGGPGMGFSGFNRPFGQGGFGRPGRPGQRPGRRPQRPNEKRGPGKGPNKPDKGPNGPGKGPKRPQRPKRPNKPLVSDEIVDSAEYQDDSEDGGGVALAYSDEVEDSTVIISSEYSDEKK